MKFATKAVDIVETQLREFYRNNELTLTQQGITQLNDQRFFELKNLQSLDLSNNKLQELPDKLAVYERSLTKLAAKNNVIT